jgi:hypothetical protein
MYIYMYVFCMYECMNLSVRGISSPGRQTPGYRGTLDRRPRHSNVQHANQSPPPVVDIISDHVCRPIVNQLCDDVPTLGSHRVCLDSLRVVSPGEQR